MNSRSLRFKLSLRNGFFISAVFLTLGLVRYQMVAYRAERSFNSDLETQLQALSRNMGATTGGFEWVMSGVVPGSEFALDSIRPYLILTDLQGRVLGVERYGWYVQEVLRRSDFNAILFDRSGFRDAVAIDGRTFRFASRIISSEDGKNSAVIHLGRPLSQHTAVLEEYRLIYIYSLPLILFIAMGVGWYLAGTALKPFEEVADTAEQITSENLNMRIVNDRNEVEIQKLVQAFNSMVARLAQSFDQMRKFNANVAHELRTPLSILQGENEIALRSDSLPEEIHSVIISNLEELGRLTRIVNDMLTLSEVQAGARVLEKKPLDVGHLIADLAEQLQLLAVERNLRIDIEDMPKAVIHADELWIRRAVLNLLDNAIKYSRDGGIIRISMILMDSKVRVSIRDDGMGISQKDLPFIFDSLFRADPARSRNTGGIGLGLTLVKWVVESHYGTIEVVSDPGEGADFRITFPLMALKKTESSKILSLKAS